METPKRFSNRKIKGEIMPYKRIGKKVYKKVNGKKLKGKSKSVTKAKQHINVLRGVEHGWKPTGKKARKRAKKAKGRRK